MAARPKDVDWAGVEAEYRAGIRSLRDIGSSFGISYNAVAKRAIAGQWPRDLKAKIRAQAAQKIERAAIPRKFSLLDEASENEVVEANANIQAAITISHRNDVQRARGIVRDLMEELESYGVNRDQLEAIAHVAARQRVGEDADPKVFAKALDAILESSSFPSRVGAVHKLADALVKLVTLERTVAGIEDRQSDESIVIGALKRLNEIAQAEKALALEYHGDTGSRDAR